MLPPKLPAHRPAARAVVRRNAGGSCRNPVRDAKGRTILNGGGKVLGRTISKARSIKSKG